MTCTNQQSQRRHPWAWALLICVCSILSWPTSSQGDYEPLIQSDQDKLLIQVKSAFLLNFIKYTQWPDDAFQEEDSPITVLILGEDPLGPTLDQTFTKAKPHDRTIKVIRQAMPRRESYRNEQAYKDALAQTAQAVQTCHLVYYAGDRSEDQRWLADTARGGDTLTVGEKRAATDEGLMFGFLVENRKLRFRVGFEAVEDSQIEINPRLLGLAQNKP